MNKDNLVYIKGGKNGVIIKMDKDASFDDIRKQVKEKIKAASKFFKDATMALSFEGRTLTDEQTDEIMTIIKENSDLNIVCLVDNDKLHEQVFEQAINDTYNKMSSSVGQFYKGNMRSGQVFESDSSLIVLGDVNPGAMVVARGNVVVLGSLKGSVHAGCGGNENCFVAALDMNPMQIRIGDVIARCADGSKPEKVKQPKLAYVENGNIYIEKIDRNSVNSINL